MLVQEEQIKKAIGAHGIWKARLREAIETGHNEFNPEIVEMDDNCDFGRWLYNDILPGLQSTPIYKITVEFHAEFHKEAARILRLSLAGKKKEALNEMKVGSKFSIMSAVLTTTMIEWQESLVKTHNIK